MSSHTPSELDCTPHYTRIPCPAIEESPFHPKTGSPQPSELVDSISRVGQLYPIIVVADDASETYALIDGRARVRAIQQVAGSDALIDAKVYPADVPLAVQGRIARELHDIDDYATHLSYAASLREMVEPTLAAETERKVARMLGMDTGRDKQAFIYGPLIAHLKQESAIRTYLSDTQTPVGDIRAGDRGVLTVQKYCSFLSSFVNTRLVDESPSARDAETEHVVRLSDALVEHTLDPLYERASDPPHQLLIDFCKAHPLRAFGQVVGEDARVSASADAPLYTATATDINWDYLTELFARASEIQWSDDALASERALKRLRREIRRRLYD